jgi:hypothetical protein
VRSEGSLAVRGDGTSGIRLLPQARDYGATGFMGLMGLGVRPTTEHLSLLTLMETSFARY